MRLARLLAVPLSAVLLLTFAPSPAGAGEPGPALSITSADLDRALECSGPLTGLSRDPVLLTPAFSTAAESYGWNYRRQLPAIGITTCSLTLPDRGFGDLQRAAEYDVAAVRRISAASGRKVALLGHQHGALDGLWALTFWPDLPGKVSDFISLATPYNGTAAAAFACGGLRSCPPAAWQIAVGSRFLAALKARPLPPGPGYTSISTDYDELIFPQPFASRLDGATNVRLQSVCPLRPVEHFSILADNVAYKLVLDALDHPGPARPERISRLTCLGAPFMPATQTLGAIPALLVATGVLPGALFSILGQSVGSEPALRAYAQQ